MSSPGRSCPLAYRYRPEDLAGPASLTATTLYVVGGLYGNTEALDAIRQRVAAEPSQTQIVFNGDFHYLDADPGAFAAIIDGVRDPHTILGNVEYALAETAGIEATEVGCGCDYPNYVPDEVVTRSNAIVDRLRVTARAFPDHLDELAELPRHLTVAVGRHRIGIIHGDPESLAGWRLALEAMEPADHAVRKLTGWYGTPTTAHTLGDWFRRAQVDVLASTHTGLPFAQDLTVDNRSRLVINNGTSGLGNFTGEAFGVLTRLTIDPDPPSDSLYGTDLGGLRCDAIPVRYELNRAVDDFAKTWPPGTPAHISYFDRLRRGAQLRRVQAARLSG